MKEVINNGMEKENRTRKGLQLFSITSFHNLDSKDNASSSIAKKNILQTSFPIVHLLRHSNRQNGRVIMILCKKRSDKIHPDMGMKQVN